MDFEGDAFISYAHLDNVELVEGQKGWVSNLHRALEVRVAQLLGKSPHIWRDPKLQGNDFFAETLVARLARVAVLVSVVSPRYIKSEWTLRELSEFWTAAERQGGLTVAGKARIFKVLKTPIPLDSTPAQLRPLLGYEFYKIDPETGKIRELDEVFGPSAQRDFWIKLDDLAHDICALLEKLESPPGTTAPTEVGKGGVFLAETTSDLREQREAIRRDLLQHGYTVFPEAALPPVDSDLKATVRENLARCRMSVHLIGKHYSLVPEGALESLIEIQNELAIERGEAGKFSRILWIPPGLDVTDPRQRQVIDRLRLDPRAHQGADLLETFLEDLTTVIHDQLKRPLEPTVETSVAAVSGDLPRLYLVYDQRDEQQVSAWADALFEEHLETIRPAFEGDEAEIREFHDENLSTCDGVLLFYGTASEIWLRRKLREIQKAAGLGRTKPRPVVGIAVIAPRTAEKERFRTHEALVIPQFEGFSLDPLRPLVSRLKGTLLGGQG